MIRHLTFNDLPFHPREDEVIYIEGYWDEALDGVLREQWQCIDHALRKAYGLHFRYLPMLWQSATPEQLQWAKPDIKKHNVSLTTADLASHINNLTQLNNLSPGVMAYRDSPFQDILGFWYAPIGEIRNGDSLTERIINIVRQIDSYVKRQEDNARSRIKEQEHDMRQSDENQLKEEGKEYTMHSSFIRPKELIYLPQAETKADASFSAEVLKLLDEVRKNIEQLRLHGVCEMLLHMLVEPEIKLSRMVVTSDLRIILPDYVGMEIKMTPLVKAVYLLFLRHVGGIRFKQLPDYRDELIEIYRRVRSCELTNKARRSIETVTDPTNNSINEKCARIREAFLRKMNETYAAYYIVTGEKNERKRIELYRSLLKWEGNCLGDVPYTIPSILVEPVKKKPVFVSAFSARHCFEEDAFAHHLQNGLSNKPNAIPIADWEDEETELDF